MQAATRNPLAGPSILGVSSGAAFAIVIAVFLGRLSTPMQYVWFAYAGALGVSALVYVVGSLGSGGPSPVKLALAGAVVTALLGAWTTTLLLLSQQTLDVVRFWLAGSLSGRSLEVLWTVLPFICAGLLGALLFGYQLNVLSLGEDTARALGMRAGRVRAGCGPGAGRVRAGCGPGAGRVRRGRPLRGTGGGDDRLRAAWGQRGGRGRRRHPCGGTGDRGAVFGLPFAVLSHPTLDRPLVVPLPVPAESARRAHRAPGAAQTACSTKDARAYSRARCSCSPQRRPQPWSSSSRRTTTSPS
jgi:hypothetical protein